jgi:hypothetical protein
MRPGPRCSRIPIHAEASRPRIAQRLGREPCLHLRRDRAADSEADIAEDVMNAPASPTAVDPACPDASAPATRNPLTGDASAARWSSYLGVKDGKLLSILRPTSPPDIPQSEMHELLRELVLQVDYPCLGARASFHRRIYRFGVYPDISSPTIARALCHDLYEFSAEMHGPEVGFASFIATFLRPDVVDERHFETLLWDQLQHIHDVDTEFFPWDSDVSSDPENPWFSFSVGGVAYYIVGRLQLPFAVRATEQTRPVGVLQTRHSRQRHRVAGIHQSHTHAGLWISGETVRRPGGGA